MPELSSGAMADIAFLLLTFYMVTTEIKDNKGLAIMLPPFQEAPPEVPIPARDIFAIHINFQDKFLVEGELRDGLNNLRHEIKTFILNRGRQSDLSVSPDKAIVSIKTDRGASHQSFIAALDEAQSAYYEIYGERVGLSAKAFRELDLNNPKNQKLYDKARKGLPMNISIAEPTIAQ